MTGFTFSEVFREMATMQQVSLRRLIRLQRGGVERETGIKFLVSTETILTTSRESLGGSAYPAHVGVGS